MLDETDSRLLAALQKNAHLTAQELGELLNLSPSQAGRRRQRLESCGIVQGYHARLDPLMLGLSVQAFVQVQLSTHDPEQAQSFNRLIETRPEVISGWALTGDADLLLRIFTEDLRGLNRFIHEVLLPHPSVSRVHSQIVMDQVKPDAVLPV